MNTRLIHFDASDKTSEVRRKAAERAACTTRRGNGTCDVLSDALKDRNV